MLIGFWFGHALYKTPLPSKIDKEIKCLSMESDWKDTAPFVDKEKDGDDYYKKYLYAIKELE